MTPKEAVRTEAMLTLFKLYGPEEMGPLLLTFLEGEELCAREREIVERYRGLVAVLEVPPASYC